MTIQLIVDNVNVPVKFIRFSDGSSNVKLEIPQKLKDYPPSAYYSISVDPTTKADDYLWEIGLVVQAIVEAFPEGFNKNILHLPYLPHARADRVFEEGNSAPLKVFLECVCGGFFSEVFLTDPHSDFYKKYDDSDTKFNVKPQHQCFMETVGRDIVSGDILISPDKGATNKIYKLQQALDVRMIATFVQEAYKVRDVETGRVISTALPKEADFKDKFCWIVDDICDGGGTFIPLAKLLKERGAKEVNLYITHGIFAKGLLPFKGIVDKIYTYQTVGTYVNRLNIDNFNRGIIHEPASS